MSLLLWLTISVYAVTGIPVLRRVLGRVYPAVIGSAPIPIFDEVVSITISLAAAIAWPMVLIVPLLPRFTDWLASYPQKVSKGEIEQREKELGL